MMGLYNIIRNEMNAFYFLEFVSIHLNAYKPRFPLQMDLYQHGLDYKFELKLKT